MKLGLSWGLYSGKGLVFDLSASLQVISVTSLNKFCTIEDPKISVHSNISTSENSFSCVRYWPHSSLPRSVLDVFWRERTVKISSSYLNLTV